MLESDWLTICSKVFNYFQRNTASSSRQVLAALPPRVCIIFE